MIFPSTPFNLFPFPGRWIPILKFRRLSFLPLSCLLFLVPNSDFELEPKQTFSSFSNAPCRLFSTALCTYTLASTQFPSLLATNPYVSMYVHTYTCALVSTSYFTSFKNYFRRKLLPGPGSGLWIPPAYPVLPLSWHKPHWSICV